ncbi:helix-turn-helix domain-containing protein [Leptolyngbya sp. NIES-2104]|uniref:helix-turn-helix domain-containing protein n=1 Tax=Leptolyngbya sp. NIES-2104 TaxID=1552121 RepID=UPI0021F1FE7D|nr:helix-turn-helix domain-containing protein [Leptolyngbya sp. NIES-2104]
MTQKAFKYRFYPTPEQESLLRRTMGCTRLVYNRALAARTEAWYGESKRIGYIESSAMLTQWKKQEDLDFLNEVSCVPLQQGLRHLQKAFSNFFDGRNIPPSRKNAMAEVQSSPSLHSSGKMGKFSLLNALNHLQSVGVENCQKAQFLPRLR